MSTYPVLLIVDDMIDDLKFLARRADAALRAEAWEVLTVEVFADARTLIESRAVDISIAVLDVYLSDPPNQRDPEGLRLARLLKKLNPRCEVILVSRYLGDRSKLTNPDAPVDDFVSLMTTEWSSPVVEVEEAIRRARSRCMRPNQLPTSV